MCCRLCFIRSASSASCGCCFLVPAILLRSTLVMPFSSFLGSVKDSVVGEERIAQYLLAVLNIRGIPLSWKHKNNRRIEGIRYDTEEKQEYNLKNLRPKRRSPPNKSDVVYIEIL